MKRDLREGIALVLVLVVLTALLLVATPFAVSMREHQVTAVLASAAAAVREDLVSARAAVVGSLLDTHPNRDETPDVDGLEELAAAARPALLEDRRYRDPRGRIWSVRVTDEQAKLNVNAISPFALANLLRKRTVLRERITSESTEIPVEDPSVFDPQGGYVVIEGELIRYRAVALGSLVGCARGLKAASEDEPIRLRVSEAYYFNPGTLVRISDGLRTDYAIVTHVSRNLGRAFFLGRGGGLRIASGFTPPANHRAGVPVLDARVYAVNLYRILREPGRCYRYPTVSAIRQITELGLPGFTARELEELLPYLTVYSVHEGAARWGNHRTVLNGFTYRDQEWLPYRTKIEFEVRYPVNLNTAPREVLVALLEGLSGERQEESVTREQAEKLADRILQVRAEEPLEDPEDFLDRVLEPAREAEEITRQLRGAIFQNLFDSPMLSFLKGGTHRGIFHSLDVYGLEAAVSRNNAAGVELSRAWMREVVSVAPPELLSFRLDSQWDFERMILPGRYSRFVTTYPVNTEFQRSPADPPFLDPPNRTLKLLSGYARNQRRQRRGRKPRPVFASRATEKAEGEDEGSVRYRPARTADGFAGFRGGVEPLRFAVQHFDNSDHHEGEVLRGRTRQVSLRGGRGFFRFRGRRRGARTTGLNPLVIGLWYRPLWRPQADGRYYIWGTGESGTSDRIELFYDAARRELILEVADTGLNRPLDVSRCYFPLRMRSHRNYHIAAVVAGTRPDQIQLLVDGVPYRGTQRARYRFLTRLTADIGPGDLTIPVESTEDFPNFGVLLIGEEKIEYRGKSKKAFFALRDDRRAPIVRRGRGARGSPRLRHYRGAAVMLYGYAAALASDLPAVSGRLTGVPQGFGRWRPALLNSRDPVVTVAGSPLGITDKTTQINLYQPGGGNLEGFQTSGFALLVSARMARAGPRPTPQNPNPPATVEVGGLELIHYRRLSGTELQGVTRGMSTPLLEEFFRGLRVPSQLDPRVPKVFLNGTERQLWVQAEKGQAVVPTWVVPVSLKATTIQGYLDPAATGVSERVQLDSGGRGLPEWVRYDELLRYEGGAYFLRTNWPDLLRLFRRLTRRALVPPQSGRWAAADPSPAATQGRVFAAALPLKPPPQQQQPPRFLGPLEPAAVARGLRGWLEFRGADGTRDQPHREGTPIQQVFRTELPGPGPGDRVTLVDETNRLREAHWVRWAAQNRPAARGRFPLRGLAHFASFRTGVGRTFTSTLAALRREAQRRGRGQRRGRRRFRGPDRTPMQILWDTRNVTRLLKAPSGELPARTTGRLIVGGTFGGRRAPCIVDEIETFAHDQRLLGSGGSRLHRILMTPYFRERIRASLNPPQNEQQQRQLERRLARAAHFIGPDARELRFVRADVWLDFGGVPRPREFFRNALGVLRNQNRRAGPRGRSSRVAYRFSRRSLDDRDCGLIRIGEEFIIYRGWEEDASRIEVVLKDCIRGAFGTEPAAHEQGEVAFFLGYVEMTVLRNGVTAESPVLPVRSTAGFPPQGYVALFGQPEAGMVREIVGYTEARGGRQRRGGAFVMPARVDRETLRTMLENPEEADPLQTGSGIFRGRFGTLPARHPAGTVVLRLPFRYWDRAARLADNPELGYFQFPLHRPEAFFKSVTWGEFFPARHLDLRVLCRVDQRAAWDEEPRGKENGLFEFLNPRGKNDPNRIDMQGDLLEVRVFFEYRPGAFDPQFNADGWKETPWLTAFRVDYVQPTRVLYHEERR